MDSVLGPMRIQLNNVALSYAVDFSKGDMEMCQLALHFMIPGDKDEDSERRMTTITSLNAHWTWYTIPKIVLFAHRRVTLARDGALTVWTPHRDFQYSNVLPQEYLKYPPADEEFPRRCIGHNSVLCVDPGRCLGIRYAKDMEYRKLKVKWNGKQGLERRFVNPSNVDEEEDEEVGEEEDVKKGECEDGSRPIYVPVGRYEVNGDTSTFPLVVKVDPHYTGSEIHILKFPTVEERRRWIGVE